MRKALLFLVASGIVAAVPALAQRTNATIRGTVTDSTGAVVPGANVTLKGEATGSTRTVATNAAGVYSFAELPIGSYTLEVGLSGFKSAVRSKIGVTVAEVREVNVQLETGDIAETVTVEAAGVSVQTVGGDVSGLITGEQVRELPLNGRNFLQLALLMPGVAAPDFLNVKDKGLLGGSDLSVSGSAVTSNMWTVDGVNNNDVGSNRTILVYPSIDAIEEFKIHRNSYGAEFGQAAGAQVNIVTRSGTNSFHGSVFYFGRDDALASRNYFLEQAGKDKEKLSRKDFGWTLGGPIIKDKLHFFASQDWNRETRGTVRTAFVPTERELNGDFSVSIPGCSSPVPVDPLTGQAFPGNQIPADRISPGGRLFLSLYSRPNTTPGAGSCNNWVDSVDTPINWRQENLRLDWTISDRTRAMFRYTQDSWQNNAPSLQANLWGDDPFPAVDSNWDQPSRSLVAQLSQNIGSSAINTLQFSYSANEINVNRGGTNAGLNAEILAAIPPLFPVSGYEYGDQRGHPVFWGGGGYAALWNEAPFRNNQDLFVIRDDYSVVFGKHFVKVGGLYSFNEKNEDSGGFGSYENSAFWGATGLNGWGGSTGNILADFLLKDMAFGFTDFSSQRQVPQRWKDLEFYASDSWKVSPRVSLDFGVRYSSFFNPYADDNRIAVFVPSLFNPALGNDPCNGLLIPQGTNWCQEAGFRGGTVADNRSLLPSNNHLIAPRVGFAWDVSGDGKTAIRAGLGQFYLRERLSPGLNIAGNPPFVTIRTGTRALDSAAPPCDGCFGDSGGAPASGREQSAATPHNWQWNVGVEREVLKNTTLHLAYVGNKGKDLLGQYDANQVPNGDSNGNGINDRLEYARTTPALASVRPYGNAFGDRQILIWDHKRSSIYHSLQGQITSRFWRGSQFQASYTWSRTIATDPLDNSSGGIADDVAQSDLDNLNLDRGLARVHRAHVFNSSVVWVLPALEGKSGLVKNVFGDWEVSAIAAAASGIPLTVYTTSIPGLNGGPSGVGYDNNQRPNRVPGSDCSPSGGPKEQIINPAAFTLTGFQIGTIGDSGRGVCEGPDFFQVDLALFKNIKVNDRVKLQLRFEVFNVLNRVNFSAQNLVEEFNPTSVTYDTGDPATATRITGYQVPANFGQAVLTRDPRQAQFGIKLIF